MDRWIFIMPNIDVGPWTLKFFGSNNLNVQPLDLPLVDTTQPRTQLVMLSVVFCVFWLVVVAIRRSPFGERLLAMKDSPAACATMGMNVTAAKLMVFAVSAAMAGMGGAFYAAALGGVANSNFDFFASLPVLLLAVVGGIGTAGGALFAGLIQVGLPLVLAPVAALAEPLKLLPGLMGIGLGRNPNGVTGDMREQFQPLWRARAVMAGLAAVLAGLFVLYKADVISGWNFGIVAVICTVRGTPRREVDHRGAQGAHRPSPRDRVGDRRHRAAVHRGRPRHARPSPRPRRGASSDGPPRRQRRHRALRRPPGPVDGRLRRRARAWSPG